MADAQDFLKDFPLLNREINGRKIAYLDNGATTQKPEQMIQSICGYYGGCNANPHRGAYALSVKATDIYENARKRTAQFIKAKRPEEIIFTKNATEALNLVAYSYGLSNVQAGDEIVISVSEHHSNLVPWQFVAKSKGAVLKYIYLERGWQSFAGRYRDEDHGKDEDRRCDSGIQCPGAQERCEVDRQKGAQRRCCGRRRRLAERGSYGCRCDGSGCRFLRFLRS
jgi:hypothetical protein